ncbi:toluene-4-sulfonate monooxygenase system iron-sulfur subunit TsaM1 [Rhodobiaceae bacterium]|nr:toluene-4-sulfonate monooxygenase system iron-sulfur subunit TsaM1 [Rhodobiaceae bacterium]
MFVHRTWYWAGWSHDLKSKPVRKKILGRQVLLFRDSTGLVRAMDAMCPHRGADLSKGKIIDDCVQCPFHGMKFNVSGKCIEIPSQPADERIPASARVDVFPIRERDGIVWIWMDHQAVPSHEPPACEVFSPAKKTHAHRYWTRHQEGDFVLTVETALEDSHVPFLHKATFAFPKVRVPPYKFEHHANGRGFTARYDKAAGWWIDTGLPTTRKLQKHVEAIGGNQKAEWFMGGHVRQHFGGGTVAGIFVTPSDERHVWFAIASAAANNTFAKKVVNAMGLSGLGLIANKVFDEDEDAIRDLILTDRPGGLERPVFQISDAICSEFRKMYRHYLRQEGREWAVSDTLHERINQAQ